MLVKVVGKLEEAGWGWQEVVVKHHKIVGHLSFHSNIWKQGWGWAAMDRVAAEDMALDWGLGLG